MPTQDLSGIKEKIVTILKDKGPSLPAYIAREIETSILFTSAFLSELVSENKLKISNMRVGSSPIYFIQGQENLLENFSEYLKSKEKEAFLILKEKSFLKDNELNPPIRVAIREIKDFAIPFNFEDNLIWRYFTSNESDFKKSKEEVKENKEIVKPIIKKDEEKLDIFDKKIKEKKIKSKSSKRMKPNEKFLEKVKEFLSKSSVEIKSIEGIKKEELILRVRINGEEQLLVAYNKRKITEKEIIKAAKKASELNLKYSVLSLGELPKKTSDLIEALKNIKDIGKME